MRRPGESEPQIKVTDIDAAPRDVVPDERRVMMEMPPEVLAEMDQRQAARDRASDAAAREAANVRAQARAAVPPSMDRRQHITVTVGQIDAMNQARKFMEQGGIDAPRGKITRWLAETFNAGDYRAEEQKVLNRLKDEIRAVSERNPSKPVEELDRITNIAQALKILESFISRSER
ncbi:MAG: hypothetical protein AAB384_04655 [Patescibacteria group bacterium]